MKATGYSLWLMPAKDSNAYKFARSLIEDLAKVSGGPVFEPHVTLIGGVDGSESEVVSRTRRLANRLSPFSIELQRTGTQRTYFRTFFAEVLQAREVMEANALAQKIFGVEAEYFPHLSLAYGDYSEGVFVKLTKATRQANFLRAGFEAQSVHLYHTEGEVSDWQRVDEFSFNQ